MAEVVITVKPDGKIEVEGEGIQGTSCSLHTAPFVKALGQRAGEKPKAEMFQEPTKQKLEAYQ